MIKRVMTVYQPIHKNRTQLNFEGEKTVITPENGDLYYNNRQL